MKLFERFRKWFTERKPVNCSTCEYWRKHSTLPGTPKSKVIQIGATFKFERDPNPPKPEDWGVCMKAPLVAIPMQGVGVAVRATAGFDVCAKHPRFVAPKVVGAGDLDFKPGLGEVAGFDRPPTLREAMAYGRLRAGHLPSLPELEKFGNEFRAGVPGVQDAIRSLKLTGGVGLKAPEVNGPENGPLNGEDSKPNGS